MEETLKILIIEDSQADFLLVERHLRQEGMSVRCIRVDTSEAIELALDEGGWDLVLSDYSVPRLNFLDSFARIQSRNPDLPVILVSGSVGEVQAVELLKLGVRDFVLKDNLTRLVPAMQRALKEKQELAERRQAEEALAAERTMLRTLINTIPDLVWLKDTNGVYLACNHEFERLYGAVEAEIVGKSDYDFVHRKLADFFREHDHRSISAGKSSSNKEWLTFAVDGHRALFETIKTPMRDSNGQILGVLGVGRDITAIYESEVALRESEERFRSLMENIPNVAVQGYALDGTVHFWNQASEHIYGYSSQEAMGKNLLDLIIPADMREGVTEAIRVMKETGEPIPPGELLLKHKDESSVPVFSSHVLVHPIGRPKEMFCLDIDLTELKKVEEELKKKNSEIEQFLYTVSHDLRSPLVTVKTFMGYLEKDMLSDNQEQLAQDIQYIHGAADKMKLHLDELLELSRVGHVETPSVSVALSEVLAEAQDTLAGVINERTVDIWLSYTDLMLIGDRPRLCQIWQNLIENAIKYSRANCIPRIELGVRQERGETVFFVKDNGIGIDPQYHSKIFGIFEKLNPGSPGAGMGLSLVQRIVEKCDGRIWVESEGSGKGSSFNFTLPKAVLQD
jgi:PAS domain S-box-containing protein